MTTYMYSAHATVSVTVSLKSYSFIHSYIFNIHWQLHAMKIRITVQD